MRPSIVSGVLLLLSTCFVAPVATGQDLNPYGRIDPVANSIAVLHRAMGANGSPAVLTSLAEADPPEIDRLLETLLDHPAPSMRTMAAVELFRRGKGDPRRLISRLRENGARAAFVVAMLGERRLDPALAATLLDESLAGPAPVAIAILAAAAGRDTDLELLKRLLADEAEAPLARGIAAGRLEQDEPGTVAAWRESLSTLVTDAADASIFATTTALQNLNATAGLRALERTEAARSADDLIRATIVLGLLERDPDSGMEAWNRLAKDSGDRLIPASLLLVSSDRPMPATAAAALPNDDAMQRAVRTLLLASPADRPKVAEAAVREGHLPSIRWVLDLSAEQVPPEVLDAMIETALSKRRAAMAEVLFDASELLAEVDPERAGVHLKRAIDSNDTVATEALLRGLVAAGSPEAARVATTCLKAPERRTRSLALLAVARGEGLEGPSVRRLGQAAAGGGDLPDDLRPLAAWHHLLVEQRSDDALPCLVDD